MIYKQFEELELSWLGMGVMRLPTIGENGPIDEKKALKLIDYAYENGVNYYDTAYMYHDNESEKFIGKALGKYPRESWYLASKMPGYMLNYSNGQWALRGTNKPITPAGIFEEQLKKCGVDYFDFYLLHDVSEKSHAIYTDENLGIIEYLLDQKRAGRIRHFGFSCHARFEILEKFLDWKDCFEFVQIQLNYMDWTLQEAGKKYELLTNRGIPVVVMEPCRGGRLASLNKTADAMLKNSRPNESIASWAFRFLQSLPNVKVVLSGMSTMGQLKENIEIFSKNDPVTEAEKGILQQALETMMDLAPCTACRYCPSVCPQGLDIPKLISLYNEMSFEPSFTVGYALETMSGAELPSACQACGECAAVCPQGIDIPEIMEKLSSAIENISKSFE